jgi:hypothetical protein
MILESPRRDPGLVDEAVDPDAYSFCVQVGLGLEIALARKEGQPRPTVGHEIGNRAVEKEDAAPVVVYERRCQEAMQPVGLDIQRQRARTAGETPGFNHGLNTHRRGVRWIVRYHYLSATIPDVRLGAESGCEAAPERQETVSSGTVVP